MISSLADIPGILASPPFLFCNFQFLSLIHNDIMGLDVKSSLMTEVTNFRYPVGSCSWKALS